VVDALHGLASLQMTGVSPRGILVALECFRTAQSTGRTPRLASDRGQVLVRLQKTRYSFLVA